MRLPLSNGCYIDPCNPALLYDSPEETEETCVKKKLVKQKTLEERIIELEKKLSQNPPYTIDDARIRGR
jgi:hypothetical protein